MNLIARCLVSLSIFLFTISLTLSAQTAKISTQDEIAQDLRLVPCKQSDRLLAVQNLFKAHGAVDADITVTDRKNTKNLIVTKKGTTDEVIVIGAHYDKVDDGCGAIDNWTGIVAIANLYGTVRAVETTKTFKFIAFDKEEKGLVGSSVFVADIPKRERANYCAMINLDSFGFSSTQILANTSSPKLIEAAKKLWKEMNLPLSSVSLAGSADADSSSFVAASIPGITFHGLSNDWQKYLHTSKDQLKQINVESAFMGYRTVLPFLMLVDKANCSSYQK